MASDWAYEPVRDEPGGSDPQYVETSERRRAAEARRTAAIEEAAAVWSSTPPPDETFGMAGWGDTGPRSAAPSW
mgnify:CR=1 FL=1